MYKLSSLTNSRLSVEESRYAARLLEAILRGTDENALVHLVDILDRYECADELSAFVRWYIPTYRAATGLVLLADALRRTRYEALAYDVYTVAHHADTGDDRFPKPIVTGIVHVLFRQRKFSLALATIEDARTRFPNAAVLYGLKGAVLTNLNKFRNAAVCLRTAVEIEPNNARFFEQLGETLSLFAETERNPDERKQLQEEAVAMNRNAIAIAPDRVRAWRNLATMLVALEHLSEAIHASTQALARDDSYFAAVYNHAYILFRCERLDESAVFLEKAETLDPASAEVHLLKGMLYWKLNDASASRNSFEKCLAISPNNPDATFYLKELEKQGK